MDRNKFCRILTRITENNWYCGIVTVIGIWCMALSAIASSPIDFAIGFIATVVGCKYFHNKYVRR